MPDIWVNGVLRRDISWDEAKRLAKKGEPELLRAADAERLGRKMADQAKTNHALDRILAEAGVDSLFDLPVECDDEVLPAGDLSDFVPKEYDHERADELYGGGQA